MIKERIKELRENSYDDVPFDVLEECLDTIDSLQAERDALPKTADGVPVAQGMVVYARAPAYDYEPASIEAVTVLKHGLQASSYYDQWRC